VVEEGEPPEVLYEQDAEPQGDELSGDGYELQVEPVALQLHLPHHEPGVVEGYEGLPGRDARLAKHAEEADVETRRADDEQDPTPGHS
jgi:hypothetical protein